MFVDPNVQKDQKVQKVQKVQKDQKVDAQNELLIKNVYNQVRIDQEFAIILDEYREYLEKCKARMNEAMTNGMENGTGDLNLICLEQSCLKSVKTQIQTSFVISNNQMT